ncbi:cupin domain-containing protein [Novosphingobium sp.]|uniref:ribosomal protein uL16 3-hydroxylase n=1 Tax=Novosphingobium sp. TaxID=1874826 RepID=UPI002733C46D|nr:cupin domain-containing protein [Novosphingobium sp.]MDP3906613.1 cupin domain-containing protein [Novosphingobium sp.]
MQLHNFDAAAFLRDAWQQRPLLIRNPWKAWANPLEPDELAGLACTAEVEARLVVRNADSWALEQGPFAEDRFAALGAAPWTLLVQAVDHHDPAVAALIAPFRFVPDWRIDDVMVSYASDGGGVGPHFDQYDVFLIQGLGRRRWQVGARCDADSALLPHDDLRLLAEFQPTEEWVLEPGDILYIPPGFAHDGVALGDDCMTYSVGFRAPSRGELIAHWCEAVLDELDEDDRYADPGLTPQANPGEITPAALAGLHTLITERLGDRAAFARWFGEYTTAPKYPEIDWTPDEPFTADEVREALTEGAALVRNPASRFAFVRGDDALFVDGEALDCPAALAERLCGADRIDPAADLLTEDALDLITDLLAQGSLGFADED